MTNNTRRVDLLLCSLLFILTPSAVAEVTVDLSVLSVEVTQAVHFNGTKLIGENPATVRVRVGVGGSAAAVPMVDARLHVRADGVDIPGSPFFSTNGPITAPLSPQLSSLNQTINFSVVPPVSNDVDFTVDLNPAKLVLETNYANNQGQSLNRVFECRKTMDLASVPINYTPGGGLPSAQLIEPGIGDAFLLAIYSVDWNYHRSPLPPLTWTQNINNSNNQLLNTLKDIRVSQIPAAGYAKPDFVYGWLPGNPFSGNGQAISIGGDVAFGNTQTTRHQRTLAHELGHLFGLQHSSQTIKANGIDEEHHLKDTENLAQLFPTTKSDVMVAGKLTKDAFIGSATQTKALNDARTKCAAGDGESMPADDATALDGPLLRVSGVMSHAPRAALFNPVLRIDADVATIDDPAGDLEIRCLDAAGAVVHVVRHRTDTLRALCVHERGGVPALLNEAPFYVLVPAAVEGVPIHRIELVDALGGQTLAARAASAKAPVVSDLVAGSDAIEPGAGVLGGNITVSWTASDDDGDSLQHTLFYTRDNGASWSPIAVNLEETSFTFAASDVPSAKPGAGLFRVRTTDGFLSSDATMPVAVALDTALAVALAAGGVAGDAIGNPPDLFLVSPNNGATFPERASVILRAAAWDLEDELLDGDSVMWESDLDGPLGFGRWLLLQDLSVGVHQLSVTALDADGNLSTDSVSVTISPRPLTNPDLSGDGVVNAQDLGLLLGQWHDLANAPGFDSADLDLNGVVDSSDLGKLLGAWTE